MPNFRVKGCFKETAEDVEITVEASSYRDAEGKANKMKMGILVSDVLPVDTQVNSTNASSTEKAILEFQESKQLESNSAKAKTIDALRVADEAMARGDEAKAKLALALRDFFTNGYYELEINKATGKKFKKSAYQDSMASSDSVLNSRTTIVNFIQFGSVLNNCPSELIAPTKVDAGKILISGCDVETKDGYNALVTRLRLFSDAMLLDTPETSGEIKCAKLAVKTDGGNRGD